MKKVSKLDRAIYVICFVAFLIALFAIGVGLDLIAVGEGGIQFLF